MLEVGSLLPSVEQNVDIPVLGARGGGSLEGFSPRQGSSAFRAVLKFIQSRPFAQVFTFLVDRAFRHVDVRGAVIVVTQKPILTDAGPTSRRVRLWPGWSAVHCIQPSTAGVEAFFVLVVDGHVSQVVAGILERCPLSRDMYGVSPCSLWLSHTVSENVEKFLVLCAGRHGNNRECFGVSARTTTRQSGSCPRSQWKSSTLRSHQMAVRANSQAHQERGGEALVDVWVSRRDGMYVLPGSHLLWTAHVVQREQEACRHTEEKVVVSIMNFGSLHHCK